MNEIKKYSLIARTLHWLVAGMIVSQFVLAKLAERAEDADRLVQQLGLLANHKSIGMTIVMLAVLRVVWRVFNAPPALPQELPSWQHKASAATHWLLYALIFALPISGWLMSSATAYSVSWFNLFAFPDLVAPSESLAHRMHDVHHILAKLMFVIAVLHILAALKHHFIDKDTVLSRMSSLAGWVVLFATIAIGIGVFGNISSNVSTPDAAQKAGVNSPQEKIITGSDLVPWEVDYKQSYIKFTGDQAGAEFVGQWQSWQAKIQFNEQQLDEAAFNVTIAVESVFSNDDSRDQHIIGSDFFAQNLYPEVTYVAANFAKAEDGNYVADGVLTMKGLTKSAPLTFSIEQRGDEVILLGFATLDRFNWNIGMGDWADTTWVGKDVQVEVRVVGKN